MHSRKILSAVVLMLLAGLAQAQTIRSGAGPDPASIQGIVDQYRADVGALNPNAVGSFGAGRREINWDGVPDALSAPNDLPANFFNSNSPRGAVFSTPGSSVQVSAKTGNPSGAAVRFGNINPTYVDTFKAFSEQRLFSPIGSNVVDMFFFIPGSNEPAVSRGFGAVYTDIDAVVNTSFEFFDAQEQSLGIFAAPASNNGLSFLGIFYDDPIVHRVRISYGNSALGPNDGGAVDVAVMDDFIFGEPISIPEPAGLGACIVAICAGLRRRRSAAGLR